MRGTSMITQQRWVGVVVLALLLSGCGSFAIEIGPRAYTDAAIEATVQARVAQTVTAAAPAAPTSAPVADAPTATDAPQATPDTAAPAPTLPPAAPLAPGEPLAMAVSRDGRVSQLTASGWQPVPLGQSTTGCQHDDDALAMTRSGPMLHCNNQLFTLKNGTWTEDSERLLGRGIGDAQGRFWVIDTDEIRVIDGIQQVRYLPGDTTGEGRFPRSSIAISAAGTLWLAGYNDSGSGLVSFDGSTWKTYGGDLGLNVNIIDALATTTRNELLAVSESALYRFDGTAFVPLLTNEQILSLLQQQSFSFSANVLREAPDGSIWIGTSNEGALIWNGTTIERVTQQDGLRTGNVVAVAFSSDGTPWLGTTYGLATRQGGRWQVALPSNSAMADSNVALLLVQGQPALPALASTPRTASISGRVVEGQQPLAGTSVELCSEQLFIAFDETPCAGKGYSQLATTDAQGTYRFADVPLGSYVVNVRRADGSWMIDVTGTLNVAVLEEGRESVKDITVN